MKLQLLRDAAAFRDLALHCIGRLNTLLVGAFMGELCLWGCVCGVGEVSQIEQRLSVDFYLFFVFFLNIAGKKMFLKKCGSGSIVLGRME